jgi:hypothetical protein
MVFRLLVPEEHVGMTAAARPKFAWYSSVALAVPMQFVLKEPSARKPLWVQQIPNQRAGINRLTLEEESPELVPGRKYHWTISHACPLRRTGQGAQAKTKPFARGWIQRASLTEEQARTIAVLPSQRDRAQHLAQFGLWYDAVAALVDAHMVNPQDVDINTALQSLLNQAGITQVSLENSKLGSL